MSMSYHNRIALSAMVALLSVVCATLVGTVSACASDDDCAPSSCCHSIMCMDTTKAPPPNCTDVLCSSGCQHGTLDCGGECRCNMATKVCNPHIRAGMPPEGHGEWNVPSPPPAAGGRRFVVVRSFKKSSGKQ